MAQFKIAPEDMREQHDSLIDAFEKRDVDLVNKCMAAHRQSTLDAIREMVADRAATRANTAKR
jgi:DNA-binding GntR family transcriptional regulator